MKWPYWRQRSTHLIVINGIVSWLCVFAIAGYTGASVLRGAVAGLLAVALILALDWFLEFAWVNATGKSFWRYW